MIIFSLETTLEKISTRINTFLNLYGSNPIVWVLIFAVIVAISFWGISGLNNK